MNIVIASKETNFISYNKIIILFMYFLKEHTHTHTKVGKSV